MIHPLLEHIAAVGAVLALGAPAEFPAVVASAIATAIALAVAGDQVADVLVETDVAYPSTPPYLSVVNCHLAKPQVHAKVA